jgi:hypothetical protein
VLLNNLIIISDQVTIVDLPALACKIWETYVNAQQHDTSTHLTRR